MISIKLFFFVLLIIVPINVNASFFFEWEWIGGSSIPGKESALVSDGNFTRYESKGFPGSRFAAGVASLDNSSFYIIGGKIGNGVMSDIWRFDSQSWTWLAGSNRPAELGLYPNNYFESGRIGARHSPVVMKLSKDSFLLCGGTDDLVFYNDCWKIFDGDNDFNVTWISGSNIPNSDGEYIGHGSRGMFSARTAAVSWSIDDYFLYLFGGSSKYDNDVWGQYNDFWLSTDSGVNWKWISGSNDINDPGFYYAIGQTGVPRSRTLGQSWTSQSLETLYLYGGLSQLKYLGDLWSFDVGQLYWTWLAGDPDTSSSYPSHTGMPGYPPSRSDAGIWNFQHHILIFGGVVDSTFAQDSNDEWTFDLTSKIFTFIRESVEGYYPDSYYQVGIPPPRHHFQSFQSQNDASLYLYGGHLSHDEVFSDVWRGSPSFISNPSMLDFGNWTVFDILSREKVEIIVQKIELLSLMRYSFSANISCPDELCPFDMYEHYISGGDLQSYEFFIQLSSSEFHGNIQCNLNISTNVTGFSWFVSPIKVNILPKSWFIDQTIIFPSVLYEYDLLQSSVKACSIIRPYAAQELLNVTVFDFGTDIKTDCDFLELKYHHSTDSNEFSVSAYLGNTNRDPSYSLSIVGNFSCKVFIEVYILNAAFVNPIDFAVITFDGFIQSPTYTNTGDFTFENVLEYDLLMQGDNYPSISLLRYLQPLNPVSPFPDLVIPLHVNNFYVIGNDAHFFNVSCIYQGVADDNYLFNLTWTPRIGEPRNHTKYVLDVSLIVNIDNTAVGTLIWPVYAEILIPIYSALPRAVNFGNITHNSLPRNESVKIYLNTFNPSPTLTIDTVGEIRGRDARFLSLRRVSFDNFTENFQVFLIGYPPPGFIHCWVHFFSENDPLDVYGVNVAVHGLVVDGEVKFSVPRLDFGQVPITSENEDLPTLSLSVTNIGNLFVKFERVTGIYISSTYSCSSFDVVYDSLPLTRILEPGETRTWKIAFHPVEFGVLLKEKVLIPPYSITVDLVGSGEPRGGIGWGLPLIGFTYFFFMIIVMLSYWWTRKMPEIKKYHKPGYVFFAFLSTCTLVTSLAFANSLSDSYSHQYLFKYAIAACLTPLALNGCIMTYWLCVRSKLRSDHKWIEWLHSYPYVFVITILLSVINIRCLQVMSCHLFGWHLFSAPISTKVSPIIQNALFFSLINIIFGGLPLLAIQFHLQFVYPVSAWTPELWASSFNTIITIFIALSSRLLARWAEYLLERRREEKIEENDLLLETDIVINER